MPGHILICPKAPVALLKDLADGDLFEIFKAAQKIGIMLSQHFKTEKMHYTIQDGEFAG